LIKYHDRTPQLQIAVSSYSELITGTEMNITCKSDKATEASDLIVLVNIVRTPYRERKRQGNQSTLHILLYPKTGGCGN
jgi:hypothetical protein